METIQTAVDWLVDKLMKGEYINDDHGLIQKAKHMEKEQIIKAFGVGCQVESTRLIGYHDIAEQYYKETYGS